MQGVAFSGNLFFDPLATGLAAAGAPDPARPAAEHRRRGIQTPAEQKALRAASLTKVSKDLERMLRERMR
ncbi:hypothetical protein LR392_10345 [Arthrobacter sp. AK04]|uniref:hypothetical protein n=1 Tax=Arthrobacter sp. AK04 TaxID=2900048 RepID=UPI001E4D4B0A|nr:hypothetical protein [Arthrobacter sp. AK04]MCD5342621.1 hypothetical protein [Arthrobacter sp. AK04]